MIMLCDKEYVQWRQSNEKLCKMLHDGVWDRLHSKQCCQEISSDHEKRTLAYKEHDKA